jgi:FixJ family two-component response regulator
MILAIGRRSLIGRLVVTRWKYGAARPLATAPLTKTDPRWRLKNIVANALEIINSVNLDKILSRLKTLTPREHEVLNQVVSGRLNKEIASELGITERTVKAHRRTIMEKMETKSLAELVTMIR